MIVAVAVAPMRVVPSGFDVSYGRTQGGVIELSTRKPRGDAYRIGGEVRLLGMFIPGWGMHLSDISAVQGDLLRAVESVSPKQR